MSVQNVWRDSPRAFSLPVSGEEQAWVGPGVWRLAGHAVLVLRVQRSSAEDA